MTSEEKVERLVEAAMRAVHPTCEREFQRNPRSPACCHQCEQIQSAALGAPGEPSAPTCKCRDGRDTYCEECHPLDTPDARRAELLTAMELAREACSAWARQNVGKEAERDLDAIDLAALLEKP